MPRSFVDWFHNEEGVKKMHYRPLGKTGLVVSYLGLGKLVDVCKRCIMHPLIALMHVKFKKGR